MRKLLILLIYFVPKIQFIVVNKLFIKDNYGWKNNNDAK